MIWLTMIWHDPLLRWGAVAAILFFGGVAARHAGWPEVGAVACVFGFGLGMMTGIARIIRKRYRPDAE
jgi:hypothetical protein